MKRIDFDKLKEVSKPVQEYINNNFHPNVTIIITNNSVKLCEDIAFTNS